MKIAKVMALVKKEKRVHLHTDESGLRAGQWIGEGAALYSLLGMPRIGNEEEFFKSYDIPEKQQKGYIFQQMSYPEGMNLGPYDQSDENAEEIKTTLGICEKALHGFSVESTGEILFVQEKYLLPFQDDEYLGFFVRRMKNGQSFLCVRTGMTELAAIIMPYQFRSGKSGQRTVAELEILEAAIRQQIQEVADDGE